ncbi:guanine nucleotide exchange factor [Phascolomyces articulosus]|uniref:Guanine nucleotide exchange factor n=1 Tax=Phascolomyces articulosus TaxID=60185 RepID=A0AAD5PAI0_9FUNG|nr:guanine nucleotide exchange factor [Phascolomyces articulosus]
MLHAEYKNARDSADINALWTVLDKIERDATNISVESKVALISSLIDDLDHFPEQGRWNEQVTTRALQAIKSLGREAKGSDELFSKRGIQILMKLGGLLTPGSHTDSSQSREALKCLSNCILLRDNTKEFVVEHDGVAACFHLLESTTLSTESQFLTCRILFFMTVSNSDIVRQLIQLDVAPVIENVLQSNVSKLVAKEPQVGLINNEAVTNEALKLLFNLMLMDLRSTSSDDKPDADEIVGKRFQCCLQPILAIIFNLPIAEPMPLIPPYTHALHALMQYPYSVMADCWYKTPKLKNLHQTPEEGRAIVSTRLCDMLDGALAYLIPDGDPDDLDTSPSSPASKFNVDATLSPLILNIRIITGGEPGFIEFFKRRLLPSEGDRNQPVNRGNSTSAQLIRLMTSTMLPQTRDAVCECLFVLCNEDAGQFTQEVGYGNAIGFLVNRGIAVEPPQDANGIDPTKQINPITGQYVSAEEANGPSLADMTDEEKEREAERLFVLFERLKKNGVISVENPITQAKHAGKFEELDDDDKKSSDDE